MFQNITLNLSPVVRHETLHGRDYYVVPMAMLTEGVHNGSNGPLLYPADELKKTPLIWNMKPIVVYHPSMNGKGVSACDPTVLEKQQVGMVMNTHFDGKLRAEAWLEKERLVAVDERVLNALEDGEMMEISTGLYTENEAVDGEFKGKKYQYIARNHKPDHLALLPDKVGACSIADGGGLMQLNEAAGDVDVDADGYFGAALQIATELITNATSHSDTFEMLTKAIRERFGSDYYVFDVFDKFVVYGSGRAMFRIGYTMKKNVLKLGDAYEAVTRAVQYRKLDGSLVGNQDPNDKDISKMKKEEFVDALISNEDTAWTLNDRAFLLGQDEGQLEKFVPVENKADAGDDEPMDADGNPIKKKKKKDGKPVPPPTKNEGAQYQNLEELLGNAAPEMRDMLQAGLASYAADKLKLVESITANAANIFTKEQLEAKGVEELQALAALAVPQEPAQTVQNQARGFNYGGQAAPAPTQNAQAQEAPLPLPVTMFD